MGAITGGAGLLLGTALGGPILGGIGYVVGAIAGNSIPKEP